MWNGLENYNDIKAGDVMECFKVKEIKKHYNKYRLKKSTKQTAKS